MPIAQRRQAKRVVRARVFGIADADQRLLEDAHDRGKHLAARQPAQAEMAIRRTANARQHPGEVDRAFVLVGLATLAPARMITVLLAPLLIAPDRLDVPCRLGTD